MLDSLNHVFKLILRQIVLLFQQKIGTVVEKKAYQQAQTREENQSLALVAESMSAKLIDHDDGKKDERTEDKRIINTSIFRGKNEQHRANKRKQYQQKNMPVDVLFKPEERKQTRDRREKVKLKGM